MWSTVALSSPVSHEGLRELPVPPVDELTQMLTETQKNPASWPIGKRVQVYSFLAEVYTRTLVRLLLDGSPADVAANAAIFTDEAMLINAAGSVEFLQADAITAARANALGNPAISDLLTCIDSLLRPSDTSTFGEWACCVFEPGDTTRLYTTDARAS